MTLYKYWFSLTQDERAKFAKRAGTSPGYILSHLIHARRVPRPALMHALAKASNGALTVRGLTEFFYQNKE